MSRGVLSCSKVFGSTQTCLEVSRVLQRYLEVSDMKSGIQSSSKVSRDLCLDVSRDVQVFRGVQRCIEVSGAVLRYTELPRTV